MKLTLWPLTGAGAFLNPCSCPQNPVWPRGVDEVVSTLMVLSKLCTRQPPPPTLRGQYCHASRLHVSLPRTCSESSWPPPSCHETPVLSMLCKSFKSGDPCSDWGSFSHLTALHQKVANYNGKELFPFIEKKFLTFLLGNLVALRGCVNSCYPAKWLSYMFTYIPSFLDVLPI